MPDLPPIKTFPYLTVISDRSPKQKAHTNLGNAKNALNYRVAYSNRLQADVALYAWDSALNGWRLLYEGKRGDVILDADKPWKDAK